MGLGEQGEAGSGQLSSARSAAAVAPRHRDARVGLCAEHLKSGRFFEECTFFLRALVLTPKHCDTELPKLWAYNE